MEGLRILLLATSIGATMAGTLYVGVQAGRAPAVSLTARSERLEPVALTPADEDLEAEAELEAEQPEEPVWAVGVAVPELEELDRLDEIELLNALAAGTVVEDIVLESGVRIGPMKVVDEAAIATSEALEPAESESRMPRRTRRRVPRPPPGPRLHPNPGQHTVLTARRMIAQNELIQGSCYAYLSEVYTRAGHRSWRKRTIVYRAEREGPYADLSLIRPGDWLYIVNDPGRTPVGTHSVMFVGWEDQARGYARTISHAGWGPPRSGRERGYDVSQTYRIIRPTM